MGYNESFIDKKQKQIQLSIYLLPVIGIIPSVWTLTKGKGNTEQQKISRLSIKLMLLWITAYISLFLSSAHTSEILSFRLLYANALITTTYFLTCIGLAINLNLGEKKSLPAIGRLSQMIFRK